MVTGALGPATPRRVMDAVLSRWAPFGIEAPYVPVLQTAVALGCGVALAVTGQAEFAFTAAVFLVQGATYLHTTMRGKLGEWDRLLDTVPIQGDESVLDLGCGRGPVLVALARRITTGHVTGVDLWRGRDQSANTAQMTWHALARARVAASVVLVTADMRRLPFPDESFDLITTALALHNIPGSAERGVAVDEALRVLKPGGRMLLVDLAHLGEYRRRIGTRATVQRRRLGAGYWYGGPWFAASALVVHKPQQAASDVGMRRT